ncbi:MAG: non-hydrolyzing UDP-N-acetylglucosamine 2-epimerase [Candidatus Zixiibacteriota bacterium]
MPPRNTRKRRLRIVSLVGARPQFVKLAALARRFKCGPRARQIEHLIVHSGQHYDKNLSEVFFDQLNIPVPEVNLKVGSGSHGAMTGAILARFERLLLDRRPDMVIVYGDTNTTLSGALAAVKLALPVGHVEAGLRSFDLSMPEEVNRRVADHVSDLLMCPTVQSVKNARAEKVSGRIVRTGDLMYELLDYSRDALRGSGKPPERALALSGEYVFLTAHRPATVDTRETLQKLLDLVAQLKAPVIFPVHPRTYASLRKHRLLGAFRSLKGLRMIDPLTYADTLSLAANASLVVTDSGGLQKEAVFLGTKCLTMREVTEWPETLRYGNHLIGLSRQKEKRALAAPHRPRRLSWKIGGKAPSELIEQAVFEFLGH